MLSKFRQYVPWLNAGAAVLLGLLWLVNFQTPLPQWAYMLLGIVFMVSGIMGFMRGR